MKYFVLVFLFISKLIIYGELENPNDFIFKLKNIEIEKRQTYIEKTLPLLKYKYEFPYINGKEVLFVYKGLGEKVKIVGDMTLWYDEILMEKITGTDIFYKKIEFDEKSRVEYRFDIDGELLADFFNKKIVLGKFGSNSLIEMKDYKKNVYKKKYVGKLIKKEIETAKDEMEFNIYLYIPEFYDDDKFYKAIYFYNGKEYLNNTKILQIIDKINNKNQNVIAVFVDNKISKDYYKDICDKEIKAFGDKVIEYVEKKYSVLPMSDYRYLVAFSENVPFVTYLASRRPLVYKTILSQSADYKKIERPFWKMILSEKINFKILMTCGEFDISQKSNKKIYKDLMENKSIKQVEYKIYPQAHTWNLWGDTIEEGITWILEN